MMADLLGSGLLFATGSNMMALGWAMMNLSMLEANMNAVERINHFTDPAVVEQERDRVTGVPGPSWPSQGKIKLDGLSIHYGDPKQLVLKAVHATIEARQKIGVVGRTGAGKSSLMNALFRLLEAADGSIRYTAFPPFPLVSPYRHFRSKYTMMSSPQWESMSEFYGVVHSV